MTDGTLLNWWQLGQFLAPVNATIPGGLLLCLSACFGSAGREIARFAVAPPFGALVSNHFAVDLPRRRATRVRGPASRRDC